MTIQGGRIPPHLRGLVIAGIRSGNLGDFLSRFSGYVGIGAEIRRDFGSPGLSVYHRHCGPALFIFVSTS